MNETMKPLHSGQTYIFTPEGLVPFGEGAELEPGGTLAIAKAAAEAGEQFSLAGQSMAECVESIKALLGLIQDRIDLCPNRRVRHLAQHARKRRVRKKNIYRAVDM